QGRNKEQCGHRGKDHGGAPAVSLRDWAAEEIAERAADRDAEHKEREDAGAFSGGEKIAEPTGGSGSAGGFTDTYADTREEQDAVRCGKAGGSCERGPDNDSPGQELFAAGGIGDAPQGDADDGVDPDEGAAEEADLRVGEVEFFAHGLDEGAGDVAVVEIENVDGEEDCDGEPEGVILSFLRHFSKEGASMLAHRAVTGGWGDVKRGSCIVIVIRVPVKNLVLWFREIVEALKDAASETEAGASFPTRIRKSRQRRARRAVPLRV